MNENNIISFIFTHQINIKARFNRPCSKPFDPLDIQDEEAQDPTPPNELHVKVIRGIHVAEPNSTYISCDI